MGFWWVQMNAPRSFGEQEWKWVDGGQMMWGLSMLVWRAGGVVVMVLKILLLVEVVGVLGGCWWS
jgi:hypothetical protein